MSKFLGGPGAFFQECPRRSSPSPEALMDIRINGIMNDSIVDGPGLRLYRTEAEALRACAVLRSDEEWVSP